jgi:hypothetical protein
MLSKTAFKDIKLKIIEKIIFSPESGVTEIGVRRGDMCGGGRVHCVASK